MQYYQVDCQSEDDNSEDTDTDDLSHDAGGVKSGHVEGSHSPFGLIYQIAKDIGWTVEYILRLPYPTLTMMLADAPRYQSAPKEKAIMLTSKEQMRQVLAEK